MRRTLRCDYCKRENDTQREFCEGCGAVLFDREMEQFISEHPEEIRHFAIFGNATSIQTQRLIETANRSFDRLLSR